MPTRRALAILVGVLLGSGALGACGGDDTVDAPAAEEPAPAAEPAQPADPAPSPYGSGDQPSEEPATTEEPPPAGEPAPAEPEAATLAATVGPGFTITLTKDGEAVTALAPGTYTIEVDDRSGSHNFHLTGLGVDEATDVGGTGTTTWEVTLEGGEYTFLCDPHAGSMVGSFSVS